MDTKYRQGLPNATRRLTNMLMFNGDIEGRFNAMQWKTSMQLNVASFVWDQHVLHCPVGAALFLRFFAFFLFFCFLRFFVSRILTSPFLPPLPVSGGDPLWYTTCASHALLSIYKRVVGRSSHEHLSGGDPLWYTTRALHA